MLLKYDRYKNSQPILFRSFKLSHVKICTRVICNRTKAKVHTTFTREEKNYTERCKTKIKEKLNAYTVLEAHVQKDLDTLRTLLIKDVFQPFYECLMNNKTVYFHVAKKTSRYGSINYFLINFELAI